MWKLKGVVNEPFVFWKDTFTKEECAKIIELGRALPMEDGTLLDETVPVDLDVRKSKTSWIKPNKDSEFIFRRITDIITSLNNQFYGYELDYFEDLQFTEYSEEYAGHYNCHKDSSYNGAGATRKLSFTIQLTDESEYEGGDVVMYPETIKNKRVLPKDLGNLIAFPSYQLHEVEPVTKGVRYSLVSWVHGPAFK